MQINWHSGVAKSVATRSMTLSFRFGLVQSTTPRYQHPFLEPTAETVLLHPQQHPFNKPTCGNPHCSPLKKSFPWTNFDQLVFFSIPSPRKDIPFLKPTLGTTRCITNTWYGLPPSGVAAHLQCNASQVAHAIAWKKVCYGAVGVSILWIIKVSPGTPDTFCFQTLKRAFFTKRAERWWYTFLCTKGRFIYNSWAPLKMPEILGLEKISFYNNSQVFELFMYLGVVIVWYRKKIYIHMYKYLYIRINLYIYIYYLNIYIYIYFIYIHIYIIYIYISSGGEENGKIICEWRFKGDLANLNGDIKPSIYPESPKLVNLLRASIYVIQER